MTSFVSITQPTHDNDDNDNDVDGLASSSEVATLRPLTGSLDDNSLGEQYHGIYPLDPAPLTDLSMIPTEEGQDPEVILDMLIKTKMEHATMCAELDFSFPLHSLPSPLSFATLFLLLPSFFCYPLSFATMHHRNSTSPILSSLLFPCYMRRHNFPLDLPI